MVVANFTHACQIIEVDARCTGRKAIGAIKRIAKPTGYPKMITVDNGREFTPQKPSTSGPISRELRWISFDPGNP